MYLDHFGLQEAPFRITPNTEFFFEGANRGATLEALLYAVTHDEGIVKISGEVGSGKTMLCRMLMERLPSNVETIHLANPSVSRDEILFTLADELGVNLATNRISAVMRALQEHLISLYGAGKQVVVLIDEAHAMPAETLEEIRLLSNLESNRHKLLQIVLFGQPELDLMLARPHMRQLKERITHNFALEPLVNADIAHYLRHRLRASGYRGPDIFPPRVIRMIAHASHGLTRRINILADKILLAAYADNTHQISARHAKTAIHDSDFHNPVNIPRWVWAGAATGVVVAIGIAYLPFHHSTATPPLEHPIAQTAIPKMAESSETNEPELTAPQPTPVTSNPSKGTTLNEKPKLKEPKVKAQPTVLTTSASFSQPTTATASISNQTTPNTGQNLNTYGPTTRARIIATQQWLQTAHDDHWILQLLQTDSGQAAHVETFVTELAAFGDAEKIKIYLGHSKGLERIGIVYGDYPTREQALEALASFPAHIKAAGPYLRPVKQLKPYR